MNALQTAHLGAISIGAGQQLVLIAGPCVIESQDHCLFLAEKIAAVASTLKIPYVFKASFDKANRSSIQSFRGPGLQEGLRILESVRERLSARRSSVKPSSTWE